MQRIHLEVRLLVIAVKFSWSETLKPGTGFLSKERAQDQTFETSHCGNSHKRDFVIWLNLFAVRLRSIAAQSPWICKVSWKLTKVHENSRKTRQNWRKFMKTQESSSKFIKFHEANHSFHCDGLLTRAHDLTLFRNLATVLFFGGGNTLCFRDAKSCNHRDGLLRARDPNALALPRIVERSHSLDNMILPHSKESQLCFHAAHPPWNPPFSFRGHVFMKRNF